MKRAVCERCGRLWGVSARVQEDGYICPVCTGRRKAKEKAAQECSPDSGKNKQPITEYTPNGGGDASMNIEIKPIVLKARTVENSVGSCPTVPGGGEGSTETLQPLRAALKSIVSEIITQAEHLIDTIYQILRTTKEDHHAEVMTL